VLLYDLGQVAVEMKKEVDEPVDEIHGAGSAYWAVNVALRPVVPHRISTSPSLPLEERSIVNISTLESTFWDVRGTEPSAAASAPDLAKLSCHWPSATLVAVS